MCPICLTPFAALLAEEEMAVAMDSPALPIEELGVARLSQEWQCGHLFCRRELSPLLICSFFCFTFDLPLAYPVGSRTR